MQIFREQQIRKIIVLDVTIRHGGIVNNFQFGDEGVPQEADYTAHTVEEFENILKELTFRA